MTERKPKPMAREPKPKNQSPRPIALGSNPLSRLSVLDLIESEAQEDHFQLPVSETSGRPSISTFEPSTYKRSGRPNTSTTRPSTTATRGRLEKDVDGMPSTS
jgi:hypothetical protein